MRASIAPLSGWNVDGKCVHPPEAYTHMDYWLADFDALFPEKAKRMHAYSEAQGWSPIAHRHYWPPVCIAWLNRRTAHSAGDNT